MLLNSKLFILSPSEIKTFGIQNLTYGSLTNKGLKKVVDTINKYSSNIYGIDLGCGDGELIYHLQKEINNSLWEGVEICQSRIDSQIRDVCIWQGDMLDENFRNYNIIHADNLCLEDHIAEQLEQKILLEFKGIYITYRKPTYYKFLKYAILLESVIVETTWNNHMIYFYKLM